MTDDTRPFVREMLREGIRELGGSSSNVQLRDWGLERYPGMQVNSINADIISVTVNHPSRIHYQGGESPRMADGDRYDVFCRPERQGLWQIVERGDGGGSWPRPPKGRKWMSYA